MTLSQQIALGILTSVLGAALWEFLNRVFPEIKKSVGKTLAACYRAISSIFSSFKKTSSFIGAKLNITFFAHEVAPVVAGFCFYGVVLIGMIYTFTEIGGKLFGSSGRPPAFTSLPNGTCECPPLIRSTYSNTSQRDWQQQRVPPRYNPQPKSIIYSALASSDLVISEGAAADCSSARKGIKSKRPRLAAQ